MNFEEHPEPVPIFDNDRNYSNPPVWWVRVEGSTVSLLPNKRAASFWVIAIPCNAIIFGAVAWFNSQAWIAWLGIFLNTPLLILCWAIMNAEVRKGPWVIFDSARGTLTLPRCSKTIEREGALHWEVVFGRGGGESLSELNLWARISEGRFLRFPLVGVIGDGALEGAKLLSSATGIPYRTFTVDN